MNDLSLVLSGDTFWCNIVNHLSLIDLYNLSQTCKYYNKNINIKHNIIDSIDSKLLEIFGKDFGAFKNVLRKTKGIISGSFIIQSILNTHWANSDIDIYIPIKGNVITKIEESGNIKTEMDDFMYSIMEWRDSLQYGSYPETFESDIVWVRTYKKQDAKYNIQVILIDDNADYIHEFIKEDFDLDICKNAYWNYENVDKINVTTLKGIVTKNTTFSFGKRAIQSFLRCEKYVSRGFSFVEKNPSKNTIMIKNVKTSIHEFKLYNNENSGNKKYELIGNHYPSTIFDEMDLRRCSLSQCKYDNKCEITKYNLDKGHYHLPIRENHYYGNNITISVDTISELKICKCGKNIQIPAKKHYHLPQCSNLNLIFEINN